MGVFLNTNAFREDLPQYWNFQEMRLVTPSSSTITIVKAANEVLQKLYRQGYHYKKAGVIVMGIGPNSPIQQDLFDINAEQFEKMKRLDAVIDRINQNVFRTMILNNYESTCAISGISVPEVPILRHAENAPRVLAQEDEP